ncbi:MAG: hypothetical protein HUJ27_15490 [Rhodobacteraceae bacterium]|nr:hypothetical protein [Paracoccaceae bacterium]
MRFLIVLFALSACVAEGPTLPDASIPDPCGARDLQHFVGQPRAQLVNVDFGVPVRFIGPDEAVTMDHNPERLNISYDRSFRVTRLFCG